MASSSGGALHAWHHAVDWLVDKRHSEAQTRELSSLGSRERGIILGDIGLTSRDFYRAMKLPHASHDLNARAMAALGIGIDTLSERHHRWYQDMQRTCMLCPNRRRCLRELNAGAFASTFREFCPNSGSFDELADEGILGRRRTSGEIAAK